MAIVSSAACVVLGVAGAATGTVVAGAVLAAVGVLAIVLIAFDIGDPDSAKDQ